MTDATYKSIWIDRQCQIHEITAPCEINWQCQEIINLRLSQKGTENLRKITEYVVPKDSKTGLIVGYGSVQPFGWTGVWLDANMYSWLKDATENIPK